MHLLSSSADILIKNPLPNDSITIRRINGTARCNGSDLGTIYYRSPFVIKPGIEGGTLSPRLPVAWDLGSVGYETMRKAFGGHLEVHAEATCHLYLGKLGMEVLYNSSHGISAHVRL